MAELLDLSGDFSMYGTLKSLEDEAPVNPDFEITLKRNIYNPYCSQPAYELVKYIFRDEAEIIFNSIAEASGENVPDFEDKVNKVVERFMETPLEQMQQDKHLKMSEVLSMAADTMCELINI